MEELQVKITCTPLSHICRVNEKIEFFITAKALHKLFCRCRWIGAVSHGYGDGA